MSARMGNMKKKDLAGLFIFVAVFVGAAFSQEPKKAAYGVLLDNTGTTFGGCTIVKGLEGSYLSSHGQVISDRINLVYTDTPFNFQDNFSAISLYADKLRAAADKALDEETILVAVLEVYHSA